MTNKKKSKKNKLKADDVELWKAMTKDVERFADKGYSEAEEELFDENKGSSRFSERGRETALPEKTVEKPSKPKGTDVDRRTEERFRKGEMDIEGRLDLHGYRQEEAKAALNDFITTSYHQGKRCVLVITGTGKTKTEHEDWWEEKPGVLKRRVPDWLKLEPIGPFVLKTHQAKAKHGGEGALYVLLRRKRDS